MVAILMRNCDREKRMLVNVFKTERRIKPQKKQDPATTPTNRKRQRILTRFLPSHLSNPHAQHRVPPRMPVQATLVVHILGHGSVGASVKEDEDDCIPNEVARDSGSLLRWTCTISAALIPASSPISVTTSEVDVFSKSPPNR